MLFLPCGHCHHQLPSFKPLFVWGPLEAESETRTEVQVVGRWPPEVALRAERLIKGRVGSPWRVQYWNIELVTTLGNWGWISLATLWGSVPSAPRITRSPSPTTVGLKAGALSTNCSPYPCSLSLPPASQPHIKSSTLEAEWVLQLWRKFWSRGAGKLQDGRLSANWGPPEVRGVGDG